MPALPLISTVLREQLRESLGDAISVSTAAIQVHSVVVVRVASRILLMLQDHVGGGAEAEQAQQYQRGLVRVVEGGGRRRLGLERLHYTIS